MLMKDLDILLSSQKYSLEEFTSERGHHNMTDFVLFCCLIKGHAFDLNLKRRIRTS